MRIPVVIEISPETVEALRAAFRQEQPPAAAVADVAETRGSATRASSRRRRVLARAELPDRWTLVEEREGETYSWPEPDEYVTFRIYEGATASGQVRAAIGECERVAVRGRDRTYAITFLMTAGGSKQPICEFLETDDYEETRDRIAIIKGKDGRPKMYDRDDELPAEYAGLRIETYRDRIDFPGAYNKLGIVAREDDIDAMLAHTLIQAQTRRGIGSA